MGLRGYDHEMPVLVCRIIIPRLRFYSVLNILPKISTRDQGFNLILQVPALVGSVTMISMIFVELGHVTLSARHGCVVFSSEGNCLLAR